MPQPLSEFGKYRRTTLHQWRNRLARIKDHDLRRACGYAIWWDYIADKMEGRERMYRNLERYPIKRHPSQEEIARGFMRMGMTSEFSRRRAGVTIRFGRNCGKKRKGVKR